MIMKDSLLYKMYRLVISLPGIGKLVYKLDNYRRNIRRSLKVKRFRLYADDILAALNTIYETEKIEFFLFWGTFLGAYREHDFIPHDFDMDIAVWNETDLLKLKENLLKMEFQLLCENTIVGEGIQEITFSYHGVQLDVFTVKRYNDNQYYSSYFEMIVSCPENRGLCSCTDIFFPAFNLKEIHFRNKKLLVPAEGEKILSAIYGDDFMIPNSNHQSCSRCYKKVIYPFYEKPAFSHRF